MSASATPAVAPDATPTTAATTAPENAATTPDTTPATPPAPEPVPAHLTGGPTFDMQYVVHPIAEINPPQNAEELAATEASIRATGFHQPVTFWVDARGQNNVIDGRSRLGIMEKLHRAGITLAENGAPLVPEVKFFEGKESEALAHARTLNLRRNLDSSQRAAVAVLSGMMERVLATQETGADVSLLQPEEPGELAKRVAATAGTNSEYIYRCIAMAQKYPHLLHAVRDGKFGVKEAKRRMDRLDGGLPEEPGPDGDPVEVAVEKPTEVYDALRNVVHEDHRETFAGRKTVAAIKKAIGKVMEDVKELCTGAAGRKYTVKEILSELGAARRILDNHQPHVVCPVCMGSGEDLDKPGSGEKCPTCAEHKYLDKLQYKELAPEYKAILEGNATPAADATAEDEHDDTLDTTPATPATPAPAPAAKPVKPAAKPKPPAKPKPVKPDATPSASAPVNATAGTGTEPAVGPAPVSAPAVQTTVATSLDSVPPPDEFADVPAPQGGDADDGSVPPPIDI